MIICNYCGRKIDPSESYKYGYAVMKVDDKPVAWENGEVKFTMCDACHKYIMSLSAAKREKEKLDS